MKCDARLISPKGSGRKPTANDDNREPDVKDELYKRALKYSFYDKHTFIGTQGGTNVLDERDDFVIKSFCYDAK